MAAFETSLVPDSEVEICRLKRRLERERATRIEAEAIAEKGLRDLYYRQSQLELLGHIAAASNQIGSVKEVLKFAIERFCRFADWSLGHAFLNTDGVLRSADAWYVTDAQRTGMFRTATCAQEFASGEGLPGTALQTGKPVWISDLRNSSNFPRFRFAERGGLKCGVAFPVLSGTEIVAVVELYATDTRPVDLNLLELMAQAGAQMGRAIERQRAQDRLQTHTIELAAARDEAKEADKAKSAFLANMSHELRTPLNAIIGFSDLMLQGIGGALTGQHEGYMRDVHASGTHLKDILNDILDISKIDAGAMELYARPVSLAETADLCRRIAAPLAEAGSVHLRFAIPENLPLFNLDPTRFKQSLLNIVSNAVKFTPRGGEVEVAATLNTMEYLVSVTDTGIGMTPEGVALALQPFRQVDSALNRRFEGTGLGLPLSKALMELQGGRLSIESLPDKGTTVHLHLPSSLVVRAA
jgi:signal transduction histidine kinase